MPGSRNGRITSIFGKLDARDRAQAVIAASESGPVTARTGNGDRTGRNG
ncbi:hypothetical protein [Kitasatospora sp. NPDC097643]